jgi:hypothetical protein
MLQYLPIYIKKREFRRDLMDMLVRKSAEYLSRGKLLLF